MPVAESLLERLSLPSRYEILARTIGPEVIRLLHPPAENTRHALEDAASAIESMGEGLFVPLFADSGTGKTTLAENVGVFAATQYAQTLTYNANGPITAAGLRDALAQFRRDNLDANESRVVPINIDDREGNPASSAELAEIKRFLRSEGGSRSLIFWPETTHQVAQQLAEKYRAVAGALPIAIPVTAEGPPKDAWSALTAQVLLLANEVDSLELLLDLDSYDPEAFLTMGDYLREISTDFNRRKAEIRRATIKPLALTIVFVSQTASHGVLSTLSSSRRFGMLDPSALIEACNGTVTGRWWNDRRGLLVQTIVALDAHVLSVPPTLATSVWRKYGPMESQTALADLGISQRSPADVENYLARSDLGRRVDRQSRSVNETRGNPARDSATAFAAYAENIGFSGARDKELNKALAKAVEYHYSSQTDQPVVGAEAAVPFLPSLIPDISIAGSDDAHCLELTYRTGDFLSSTNRSTIAKYCLDKLKNYARALGWVAPGE